MRVFLFLIGLLPAVALGHRLLTREDYRRCRVTAIVKQNNSYILKMSVGKVDLKDVVVVHFERSLSRPKEGFLVVLVGGCWVYADSVSYDSKTEKVSLTTRFGRSDVPADYIRCVLRVDGGREVHLAREWGGKKLRRDLLLLKEAKPVRGTLLAMTEKTVTFESKALGGKVEVGIDDLKGIVFITTIRKEKRPEGGPFVRAYLTDGAVISGALVGAEGRRFSLRTFSLGSVTVELEHTESLYILHPDIVFLSDIDPVEVKETPLFDRFLYPWQRDVSLEFKRHIMVHGRIFWKGISCHSRCELSYELGGGYEAFCALAALDDESRGEGDVDMAVFVDGKKVWEKKGVKGSDKETFLKVDLRGAKRMRLLVDFGRKLHILDRAVWADAFLIKRGKEEGR